MTAYDSNLDRYPAAVFAAQPARRAIAVVPSDTKDLTDPTGDGMPTYAKALYVGVTGDVALVCAGDKGANPTTVVFKAHPIGYLPVQVRRVLSTGTTADKILALVDN